MARILARDRNAYFVGAGLSCALRLPNTAGLLDGVLELAEEKKRWGTSEKLPARLRSAFEFFYPDAVHGFRPDVVDFFSALRTYADIGAGFAGAFKDASDLYRSLKLAIVHLLIERTRAIDDELAHDHSYLQHIVVPGNIVVTPNWDLVIERVRRTARRPGAASIESFYREAQTDTVEAPWFDRLVRCNGNERTLSRCRFRSARWTSVRWSTV
jgi:hypothetical protein